MDLRQLKSFIAVAESGSLSRAADRLQLSQPGLSRQIQLLEAAVGQPLFDRHARGMSLTAEGEKLLERVRGPVRQLEGAIDEARDAGANPAGRVVLGMVPSISDLLAARLALQLQQVYPDISLRLVDGYGGHLLDWLYRGDIDLALMYGPGTEFHCPSHELFYEPLHLAGPPGQLDSNRPTTLKALCELPLVLPSTSHGLRGRVESAAHQAGKRLQVVMEVDSFRVMKGLVSAGFGYTVLPASALREDVAAGRLSATAVEGPRLMRQIVLAQAPGLPPGRATLCVAAQIRELIESLIDAGELADALLASKA